MILLLAFLEHPLGAPPSTWKKYKKHINIENGTFLCFDGLKIIPLSSLNDNYLDCLDGSDEPGTPVGTNPEFYCINGKIASKYISRWSVSDGICDCCDGSDEFLNPHSNCTNTCGKYIEKRKKLINDIATCYKKGIALNEEYRLNYTNITKQSNIKHYFQQFIFNICNSFANKLENDEIPSQSNSSFVRMMTTIWNSTFMHAKERQSFLSFISSSLRKLCKRFSYVNVNTNETSYLYLMSLKKKYAFENYEVSFMRKAKQGSTVIGRYRNVSGSTMFFDNGKKCWDGRRRSFTMEMVCSNENKLTSVNEAETCVYRGTFATPIVCEQSLINGLPMIELKKLKRIRKELGI